MKIHREILIPVLLAFIFMLTSTEGNSQVVKRRLGCRDSFNYALLYYNKGQFEKINNYLADCMEEIEKDKARYKDEENLRPLVFKVYKIIITSHRNLDEEKLAIQKKDDLIRLFYGKLDRKEVERLFDETELTEIR